MAIGAAKSREKGKRPVRLRLDDPRVWRPICEAPRLFLFLDLDGTLAEIAPHPEAVFVSPNRRLCLEKLSALLDGLVAVVSGRSVKELQRLIAIRGIFYVGLHGLEIASPQGESVSHPVDEEIIEALQSLRKELAASHAGVPGIFLEDKGLSLALHFRLAKRKAAHAASTEFLQAISGYQKRGMPLEVVRGKEVVEVKPAGADKGKAVTLLWKRYGEGATPVYVGDDVTDEDAFKALRSAGITILVAETARPTSAAFYVRTPEEVYAFLDRLMVTRAART